MVAMRSRKEAHGAKCKAKGRVKKSFFTLDLFLAPGCLGGVLMFSECFAICSSNTPRAKEAGQGRQ
jgi:hypothetical protein